MQVEVSFGLRAIKVVGAARAPARNADALQKRVQDLHMRTSGPRVA
jgi:hypothetical protein